MNDRLIKLFITLEALLIFDEHEPLSNNISERSAFIVGRKYKERKNIKSFLKEMYDYRSAHIHHGKSKIDPIKLDQFTRIVRNIIITLILIKDRHKLTETNIKSWFEKKKLS